LSRSVADNIAYADIKTTEDLLPPGAKPGTVPTDLEQATGLERLEILGKVQGVDVFDMKPLDSSRVGTLLMAMSARKGNGPGSCRAVGKCVG
jgi:hypothetical protein